MATDGPAATSSLPLPDVIKAPISPDLVNSVHALMRNNSRQPDAVSILVLIRFFTCFSGFPWASSNGRGREGKWQWCQNFPHLESHRCPKFSAERARETEFKTTHSKLSKLHLHPGTLASAVFPL